MHANLDFAEQVHVVSGIVPVSLGTGANAGDWICLKNYEKVSVIFFKNVGKAAEDPTIVFEQATSIGGSAKDLVVIDKIYVKQAASNLLSTGTFSVVTQSIATNFVGDGTSGEEAGLYIIDFYANQLDIANDYDCFRASIADVGTVVGNVPYGALLYLLWPPRYGEQALLSAIVD